MESKTCIHCSAVFDISDEDLAFYTKVSLTFAGQKELIPPPSLCPDCRTQRRLSHRNERKLYHRKCDKTGKQIVSIYPPSSRFKIYEQQAWWADDWNAGDYAKDVHFDVPFFEQYKELQSVVPRLSIFNQGCENSEYTNQSYDNKNCYLCSAIRNCHDGLYIQNSTHLTSAVDTAFSQRSELLYDCVDTYDSYNCVATEQCIQCSDSWFLYDCVGCRNCIACVGLRNKQYYIGNQPRTKEEYEAELQSYALSDYENFSAHRQAYLAYVRTFPHVCAWIKQSENVSGNNIVNSRNAFDCFDVFDVEDCKHSAWIFESKDVYDAYGMGKSELIYECIGVEEMHSCVFCTVMSSSQNCQYCDLCFSCKNCFGCIGMRNAEYCILNKQYTKEEYEELVPKIIEHMRKTGEWGEFPPTSLSPFGYNDSVANAYFPLSAEEAASRGWQWTNDEESQEQYLGPDYVIPSAIGDVPDDITKQILRCQTTGKLYKIIPSELLFYRNMQLPAPRTCPDDRYRQRMALRNPRHLWARTCSNCKKLIQTTYSPDRPEIVYCEDCYLSTVY